MPAIVGTEYECLSCGSVFTDPNECVVCEGSHLKRTNYEQRASTVMIGGMVEEKKV